MRSEPRTSRARELGQTTLEYLFGVVLIGVGFWVILQLTCSYSNNIRANLENAVSDPTRTWVVESRGMDNGNYVLHLKSGDLKAETEVTREVYDEAYIGERFDMMRKELISPNSSSSNRSETENKASAVDASAADSS